MYKLYKLLKTLSLPPPPPQLSLQINILKIILSIFIWQQFLFSREASLNEKIGKCLYFRSIFVHCRPRVSIRSFSNRWIRLYLFSHPVLPPYTRTLIIKENINIVYFWKRLLHVHRVSIWKIVCVICGGTV